MALESASNISDLVSSNPTSSDPVSAGDDHLRLIKAVLLANLGGIDGAVLNGTGGELASAQDFIDLFDDVASLSAGLGSAGAITGEVRAFYGDTDNIPAGWALCDGSNGTPDMRGRMLIGGNESPADGLPLYEGATTGGAIPSQQTTGPAGGHSHTVSIDDHTLTIDNLPAHRHFGFADVEANNTSGGNGNTSTLTVSNSPAATGRGGNDDRKYVMDSDSATDATVGRTSATGAAEGVEHTNAVAAAVGNHTHTLDGSSLPPWHAVHYIMFIGESAS